jgi:hypothetical protein
LEALCKRLRQDAQKLREEKTTLEGMVESHDELIMEMAEEYGINHIGEEDNNEDEDDDNEGNTVAPPTPMPPVVVPEKIIEEDALMVMRTSLPWIQKTLLKLISKVQLLAHALDN